jgi:hypothetical protein
MYLFQVKNVTNTYITTNLYIYNILRFCYSYIFLVENTLTHVSYVKICWLEISQYDNVIISTLLLFDNKKKEILLRHLSFYKYSLPSYELIFILINYLNICKDNLRCIATLINKKKKDICDRECVNVKKPVL